MPRGRRLMSKLRPGVAWVAVPDVRNQEYRSTAHERARASHLHAHDSVMVRIDYPHSVIKTGMPPRHPPRTAATSEPKDLIDLARRGLDADEVAAVYPQLPKPAATPQHRLGHLYGLRESPMLASPMRLCPLSRGTRYSGRLRRRSLRRAGREDSCCDRSPDRSVARLRPPTSIHQTKPLSAAISPWALVRDGRR